MPVNYLQPDVIARRTAAEQRWTTIAAHQPHLRRAVGLQRRTLGAQLDLVEALVLGLVAAPTVPETAVLHRLADGVPVLRTDIPPLPIQQLAPAMGDLARAIARESGYSAADLVARELDAGTVDAARLLALVYQRDQDGVRQLAIEHSLVLDMLWLVGDLVVAPVVYLQQKIALREDQPDSPVREALGRWDQGYCPACGSWPALAEFFYGERMLRCAFCACAWRLPAMGCTYCGERGDRFATIVPRREQIGRRLELCRSCGGFLKTLDVEDLTPFPLVAIEDLASSDLDQAALHHGFKRIPLRPL